MTSKDSTYLPLQSGAWAYLATFQDVYTKRVVGWQVLEYARKTYRECLASSAAEPATGGGATRRVSGPG